MDNFRKLDLALRAQTIKDRSGDKQVVEAYALAVAEMENALVVVSDLQKNTSRIFAGKFGERLGLQGYSTEDSIWERQILDLISEPDRDEKFISELRFFHFVRHMPVAQKRDYYLVSCLKILTKEGIYIDVRHRMFYFYADDGVTVTFAVCIYQPATYTMPSKSGIINSVTGVHAAFVSRPDIKILSNRECQVLALIQQGLTSAEIAETLYISRNTVNRHRQAIISRLQVRNTTEAIKVAKMLNILV